MVCTQVVRPGPACPLPTPLRVKIFTEMYCGVWWQLHERGKGRGRPKKNMGVPNEARSW